MNHAIEEVLRIFKRKNEYRSLTSWIMDISNALEELSIQYERGKNR